MTQSGIVKNFLTPVNLDTTSDFIACKLSAALQAAYKEELCQNYLSNIFIFSLVTFEILFIF